MATKEEWSVANKVIEWLEITGQDTQELNAKVRELLSKALNEGLGEFLRISQYQLYVYLHLYNNAKEDKKDIDNQIEWIKNSVKYVLNKYLYKCKKEKKQTELLDYMYKSYPDFLLLVIDNIDDEDLNGYAEKVRGIKDPYVTVDWRNAIINDCKERSEILFIPPINQDK